MRSSPWRVSFSIMAEEYKVHQRPKVRQEADGTWKWLLESPSGDLLETSPTTFPSRDEAWSGLIIELRRRGFTKPVSWLLPGVETGNPESGIPEATPEK